MLKNYLVTALNNLLKNPLFSLINLLGLAIGLACTLLVGLFVFDELGYDRHYADADRIYRVSRDFTRQNLYVAPNAPLVAELLLEDFPEIEQSARIFGGQVLLSQGEIAYYERNIRFVDNAIFDIFNLQWVAGSPSEALTRPFTVVLTESIAAKYFGTEPALGQTLLLENQIPMEVTGVIADLPHNTHLDLSVLASMATVAPIVGESFMREWGSNNFHTYIKLRPGVSIDTISSQFPAFLARHMQMDDVSWTAMTATPLRDIHLHSTRQGEMKPAGSIDNMYLFSVIALFVLLIACCNFMNLSTARSSRRGKEVGIRKTLGASRGQIARQFVGESVLLTVLASALALVLVELALPAFNGFLGKQLTLNLLGDGRIPLLLLGMVLVVGLVAGSYPAFFLSSFKPVEVLRSVLATGSPLLRNALVVLQFSIAIVLVVATLVVLLQMRYARNIDPGFVREQVVVLGGSPTAGLGQQWQALREELLRHPEILGVGASAQTPLSVNTNATGVRAEGENTGRTVPFMSVDVGFFETYDIGLLAGRTFSSDFPADRMSRESSTNGFILNRLAAEQFGWTPEEAIGKSLTFSSYPGSVIGVVENSYFESVRSPLKPMVFQMPPYFTSGLATMPDASLRLSGRDLAGTLAYIDATWRRFMPEFPILRRFLDEDFERLYEGETRQGQLFYWFSLLAIFIACMGLYGLASFNAERRRKEIGVRKVMGGSVWSIVLLLTNDFSRLVLVANVIAWPIAYVAMNSWLENFAYRIDLTPMVFIGSGLIALCIAWVTVGGTAAKAANQKPVLALRYE